MNEGAERRDHQEHHRGQLVDLEPDIDVEASNVDPGIEILINKGAVQHVDECAHGEDERTEDAGDGDYGGALLEVLPEQSRDQEAGERQERYEYVFEHKHLGEVNSKYQITNHK